MEGNRGIDCLDNQALEEARKDEWGQARGNGKGVNQGRKVDSIRFRRDDRSPASFTRQI